MLARLVGNLRLRFAVAITLAELHFLRAWVTLKGRCRMKRDAPRLALALKAWGASSKEDARAKARAISARNKGKASCH